jgi:hypothetical protein
MLRLSAFRRILGGLRQLAISLCMTVLYIIWVFGDSVLVPFASVCQWSCHMSVRNNFWTKAGKKIKKGFKTQIVLIFAFNQWNRIFYAITVYNENLRMKENWSVFKFDNKKGINHSLKITVVYQTVTGELQSVMAEIALKYDWRNAGCSN